MSTPASLVSDEDSAAHAGSAVTRWLSILGWIAAIIAIIRTLKEDPGVAVIAAIIVLAPMLLPKGWFGYSAAMKRLLTFLAALAGISICMCVLFCSPPYGSTRARFVDPPSSVDDSVAEIRVEVPGRLLAGNEVFVGVIPAKTPSTLYIQGGQITSPASSRWVRLGEGQSGEGEKFQVVLVTCPRGMIKGEGSIRVNDLERMGVEIVATHTMRRDK
jgi:hypothetical protein